MGGFDFGGRKPCQKFCAGWGFSFSKSLFVFTKREVQNIDFGPESLEEDEQIGRGLSSGFLSRENLARHFGWNIGLGKNFGLSGCTYEFVERGGFFLCP